MPATFRISKDSPAFYHTAVTKDRLPVFRTQAIARLMCESIEEARRSAGFLLFGYVIMLDHTHLVTDSRVESKELHRYVNGIAARRIIDFLRTEGQTASLEKLRIQERSDGWRYSLWQHKPDSRLLWNEHMLWQRIQYTHLNPVRAGFVEHPNDWKWSSARIFHGRPSEVEPLEVDHEKIAWRR